MQITSTCDGSAIARGAAHCVPGVLPAARAAMAPAGSAREYTPTSSRRPPNGPGLVGLMVVSRSLGLAAPAGNPCRARIDPLDDAIVAIARRVHRGGPAHPLVELPVAEKASGEIVGHRRHVRRAVRVGARAVGGDSGVGWIHAAAGI